MLEIRIKYETELTTVELIQSKAEILKYQNNRNIIKLLYNQKSNEQSIVMAQINEVKYWFEEDGTIKYLESGKDINEIDRENLLKTVNDIIEQASMKLTIFPKINKIGGKKWN